MGEQNSPVMYAQALPDDVDETGDAAPPPPPRTRPPVQSMVFFLLLLTFLVFMAWVVFRPFIIFMTAGLFIAVLALPVDKRWERILPNRLAAVATMLTVLILLAAPLTLIGFALFQDAQDAVESIQRGDVEDRLEDLLAAVLPDQTAEERNETIAQIWDGVRPRVLGFLNDLADEAVGFIGDLLLAVTVILFVVYYVLADGHRLVTYLRRAAPLPARQVDFLLHEAHNGLRAVFVGQILTSLIQGGLGAIGFLIAGVPGWVLWGAVMAVLSLLPVVGAFLVWVPAAIYLLATGDIWQGVFLIVWGIVVVSQIDNFVRPRLIGNRADIHPIFVLLGVLGGAAAFGFIGLFLGPMIVGVLISILKVWERDYLDPALGPQETASPTPAVK